MVLFQSSEPFGVAAVVAYFSCLTLTILLFSAPYFASYFINYYRKLHQIEEAIVLLSEHKTSGIVVKEETYPPHSAVSLLEENGTGEHNIGSIDSSHLISETTDTGEEPVINSYTSVDSLQNSTASKEQSEDTFLKSKGISSETVLDVPKRKKTSKKEKSEPLDVNTGELQLSLFDLNDSKEGDFTDAGNVEEIIATPAAKTELYAFLLLDSGCSLYLRGDSPFSRESGILLRELDVGKYVADPFELEEPIEVQFLINDDPKRSSLPCKIEPNICNECYPDI